MFSAVEICVTLLAITMGKIWGVCTLSLIDESRMCGGEFSAIPEAASVAPTVDWVGAMDTAAVGASEGKFSWERERRFLSSQTSVKVMQSLDDVESVDIVVVTCGKDTILY